MYGYHETFLVLGGSGQVGYQVAKDIAARLNPKKIIISALYQHEVDSTLKQLRERFPNVTFEGHWGNLFTSQAFQRTGREALLSNPDHRRQLFQQVFGPVDTAYQESALATLLREVRPDVVVDCVNTATAISYQDAFTASFVVEHELREEGFPFQDPDRVETLKTEVSNLLLAQAIPQLIRHVTILYYALRECGTRLYLKIGTTGTGGMGLNIPYTHGEDKPSSKLMAKTATAFAQTGLLFLMNRTPNTPVIKEIKPGALIGFRNISFQGVKDREHPSQFQPVYEARKEDLSALKHLNLRPQNNYPKTGDLYLACVDTGENGIFTRGEFEAITHINQMEFVTPEEIANCAALEIVGKSTGLDVIGAIDGAIMDPSYRAGLIRGNAIQELKRLETLHEVPSVAIGQLGPPQLAKYLWEAYLFSHCYPSLAELSSKNPEEVSAKFEEVLNEGPKLRNWIVSVGVPILYPDGKTFYRGPKTTVPEFRGEYTVPLAPASIDQWAKRGWVDLRTGHMRWWLQNFQTMYRSREIQTERLSSEPLTRRAYLRDTIEIGEVVAWVFNNDPEIEGYRII